MLWPLFHWLVWRINLAFKRPGPNDPPVLKKIDDLTADWVLESPYVMGEDAWLCPRCANPAWVEFGLLASDKPDKCEKCGWFKPGPLDLLAREG